MIIGIAGPAGCGKDTAGLWFSVSRGYTQRAFAQPIKEALAAMGLPEPALREHKESLVGGFDFTWRHAAQTLGTEWGRGLDENIWLKLTMRWLKETKVKNIVFTDVRFENEAQALRDMGGIILHIRGRKAELGEHASHASESPIEFKEGDFEVDNSKSLTDFHLALTELFL